MSIVIDAMFVLIMLGYICSFVSILPLPGPGGKDVARVRLDAICAFAAYTFLALPVALVMLERYFPSLAAR